MGIKFPTPCWKTLIIKFPPPREKGVKCPGYALEGVGGEGMLKLRFDRYITLVTDRGHVQMWSTVLYIRVLLDQFFTGSCSCTLAKILDVMIDSEMSFPEGEISSNSHVYKGKYLQLKCSVSMPENIAIRLNRGREGWRFYCSRPQVKGFCWQLGFCKQMGILYGFFFSKIRQKHSYGIFWIEKNDF